MEALLDTERKTAHISEIPVPTPAPNDLRIRVKDVALHPVDSLYILNRVGRNRRVIGSGFAGIIDLLGDSVQAASGLKVGFLAAGFFQDVFSDNERHAGAFQDDDWPTQILDITSGQGVDYAYDCIFEGSTVADTGKTLASSSKMAIVRSREGGARSVESLRAEPSYGAVWEGLGETMEYQGMSLPASAEARACAGAFYKRLSDRTKLMPNPIRAMPGGLEAIVDDGLRLLGSGTMEDRKIHSDKEWMTSLSTQKMVYNIAVD